MVTYPAGSVKVQRVSLDRAVSYSPFPIRPTILYAMSKPASVKPPEESPELSRLNARTGLWLFGLYSAIYALFVGLSAFSPHVMARPTPLGANLAILYGLGLIMGAFLLALVYMVLCRRNARRVAEHSKSPGETP
jgi:uncharacterized membrane protein (DUF485 family)